MRPMPVESVGGGKVNAPFNSATIARLLGLATDRVPRGTLLSRAQLATINRSNYQVLVDKDYIHIWPASVVQPAAGAGERHLIASGFGKFTVVEGTVLGRDLSRDEAEALVAAGASHAAGAAAETKPKAVRRDRQAAN